MTRIKLKDKIVTFTGPPDSGKSSLVKYLLRLPEYRRHLVYDPLFGFDTTEVNAIRPENKSTQYRRYEVGNPELNEAVDEFVLGPEPSERPHYFVVDESGRLLPNGKDEGPAMGDLNDFNAHYGVGLWIIGQRLAQLNTDLENKSTHHFVMGYKGKNDKRALRELHENLPEKLDEAKARWGDYAFVWTGPNNSLKAFPPVDEVGSKGDL